MNWILERTYSVCNNVRDHSIEPVSFKKLIGRLRREFLNHDFDVTVTVKKEKFLAESEFYVMAYYDSDADRDNETSIEIVLHHNFLKDKQFGSVQKTEILTEIFDATVHEYRHQQQSRQRQCKSYGEHYASPYSKYLSDPDELDAYALSIAIELLRTVGEQKAKTYLTRITVLSRRRNGVKYASPNLNAYIRCFGFDFLVRRLAKKVYKHLETLDKRYIFL
jgi:hypothetical protein